MTIGVFVLEKDDPLYDVFDTQDNNLHAVDQLIEDNVKSTQVERTLLKKGAESISLEMLGEYTETLKRLDKRLGIDSSTLYFSLESMQYSVSRERAYDLSVESITVRLKTIAKAIGKMVTKILHWLGRVVDRMNEVIEGTYKRAIKNKKEIETNKRSIFERPINNKKLMRTFMHGDKQLKNAEVVKASMFLTELLKVEFQSTTAIANGFITLASEENKSREEVLKDYNHNTRLGELSSTMEKVGKEGIRYVFSGGVAGITLRIERPNITDPDFDPTAFKASIKQLETKTKPKRAVSLSADDSIAICNQVIESIELIKSQRKTMSNLATDIKRISKEIERRGTVEAEYVIQRRKDLLGISKVLLGELNTVYKYAYAVSRRLIDFTELSLMKTSKLNNLEKKKD